MAIWRSTQAVLQKKTRTFLSVNVVSTKVLIWDTFFTSPTGDETAISTWSTEPRAGPALCRAKAVPSFLRFFKDPDYWSGPGIEPETVCT